MDHARCGLRGKNNFLVNIYVLRLVFGLGRIWNSSNLLDFIQKVHLFKDILQQPFSGNSDYLYKMMWILVYTLYAWKNNSTTPWQSLFEEKTKYKYHRCQFHLGMGLFMAQLLEISTVCSSECRSGALLMQCFHHKTHSVPPSSSKIQC